MIDKNKKFFGSKFNRFLTATISLLLAILLYNVIPVELSKIILRLAWVESKYPDVEIYYHDLDGNGISNRIELKFPPATFESAVKAFLDDSTLIDQWNFSEKWVPNSCTFGDYDGNGRSEIYIFTSNGDSLFLYSVEPAVKKDFLLKRTFVCAVTRPNPNPRGIWDFSMKQSVFIDCDDDGYKEMVFPVMSGLSRSPRKVLAVSVKKGKVIKTTDDLGMNIATPVLVADSTSADTIIYFRFSNATSNIREGKQFTDYKCWFVALDKDLQFVYDPIPFGSGFSDLMVFHKIDKGTISFFAAELHKKGDAYIGELSWINSIGEIIKKLSLNSDTRFAFQHLDFPGNNDNLMLFNKDKVYRVNSNFELEEVAGAGFEFNAALSPVKISADSTTQFLASHKGKFVILDGDLQSISVIEVQEDPGRGYVISRINRDSTHLLGIELKTSLHFYEYVKNPLFVFRYLIFMALILLSFGFVTISYRIAERILLHYSFSKLLFRNSQRGILVLDSQGRIIRLNEAFQGILGKSGSLIKGEHFEEYFKDVPEIKGIINRMRTNQQPAQLEFSKLRSPDYLKLQVIGYPLYIKSGVIIGYYIELLDYSDPVNSEIINLWAGTVERLIHDLKTPLSSLHLLSQTIEMKLKDDSPESRQSTGADLLLMRNELERLKKFTKRFIQFSHLDKPYLSMIKINEIISDVLLEFSVLTKNGIEIVTEFDSENYEILGDQSQIESVIQIVVKNAVDALPGYGKIFIRTRLAQNLGDSNVEYMLIEIFDSGCGISPDFQAKVFDPYFTTKTDGSGMGLSIAKKIILQHGGFIALDSDSEYSTKVSIMLPTGNTQVIYE